MLKKQSFKFYAKYKSLLQNERGAQTLEWVAVAAVVITIAALLGAAFNGSTGFTDMVKALFEKVKASL